jgi:thiamine-phosphate pyrophosphorylase
MLLEKIRIAAAAGVDWIQIREKNLSGRALADLARKAVQAVPTSCRILINDRLDVACAVGVSGVHLAEHSISVAEAKRLARGRCLPDSFLIGASTHSLEAAQTAADSGANCLIFGPIFATPSKVGYGSPQGIARLAELCRAVSVPVLAIGGITLENARACADAGAAGIAAIRIFQDAADLPAVIRRLRQI